MKLNITFREALCLAQEHEMENDPNVFIYGLDIGDHKECFGTVKGLRNKFGDKRVFSTPLSEDALTGIGIGAAISGLRPIMAHIRMDFMLLCLNQLANMAGNIRYLSQGRLSCPFVVRGIIGRGFGQGSQHSKEIYQLFQWIPGIKLVIPSTPQDAYSLLRSSIRDNDPVVFVEHRWLHDVIGEVDTEFDVGYGKEKVIREAGNKSQFLPAKRVCGWECIEALKDTPYEELIDHRGLDYQCNYPPVPTTRCLETEWYRLRYKKQDIDTYGDRFKGPF